MIGDVVGEIEQRRSDLLEFVNAVYGITTGKAHVAYGIDGHFNNGRYEFDKGNWREFNFTYPGEDVDKAVDWILCAAPKYDMYLCPYLMYADKRTPGATVTRTLLHVDWDGSLVDQAALIEKVTQIAGFAVASGTPGHAQIFVPLIEPVTGTQHRALCEALHKYLPPGSDTKKATNDVFRMPGTRSHKSRARGGDSTPVEYLIRPTGTRIEPDSLAGLIGVCAQHAAGPVTNANTAGVSAFEGPLQPVDLTLCPAVTNALKTENSVLNDDGTVDRSETTMKVARACVESQLSLDEIRWVINQRPDLAERVDEFLSRTPPVDDVLNCFVKADSSMKAMARSVIEAPSQLPGTGVRSSGRQAKVTWANTITPEPVTWAWEGELEDSADDSEDPQRQNLGILESSGTSSGRVAAGTLAIAAGPEGVGKSCFGTTISARVSMGTLPGAWFNTPRRVLYIAVEDSWKHTIVPRLIAAGADLSRIGRFEVTIDSDATVTLSLPFDNELLEQQITEHDVAVVVLDPMLSVISEGIDSHRERDVRRALDPLAAIAERTGAVILGIAHFNKSAGTDVSARITGSGAFKNVPRAVFGFARDPETGDCVLTQSKNSLGRYDLPSLRYRIESVAVPTPTGIADTGRFVPLGESDKSVGDILATSSRGSDDQGDDGLTPAQRFIIGYIKGHADENGEVPCREVIAAGVPAGYTQDDLVKARNKAKTMIFTRKAKGGKGDGWLWSLLPEVEGSEAQRPELEDSEDSKIPTFKEPEESSRSAPPGVPGLYGDLCACGKFAARFDSGLCEWCTAKARKS